MFRSSLLLLVLLPAAVLTGCSKEKESAPLGEAIGANVDARGTVPAMSVALAVTQGTDPVPLLPKVVGAVSTAVGGCPAFVSEGKDPVTALPFSVTGGKLQPKPKGELSTGAKCVVAALDGKEVAAATTSGIDGRIEIKLTASAAKAP